jgi:hypothetical protein
VQHDGALHGLVDADDRDLGRIDDRRRHDAAEPAETGDRDRRAREFLARRLARARGLGDAANLGGEIGERARLGVTHDRHLETVRRLGRDTDVHRAMADDDLALGIVERVALRELLEHARQRRDDERQVRQRGAPFADCRFR